MLFRNRLKNSGMTSASNYNAFRVSLTLSVKIKKQQNKISLTVIFPFPNLCSVLCTICCTNEHRGSIAEELVSSLTGMSVVALPFKRYQNNVLFG